jgi:hypothetical protein
MPLSKKTTEKMIPSQGPVKKMNSHKAPERIAGQG